MFTCFTDDFTERLYLGETHEPPTDGDLWDALEPLKTIALGAVLFASMSSGVSPASGQQSQSYRHPAGFTVAFPGAWRVHESLEGVVLVPNDLATDAMGQPLEIFALGSDEAPGIIDPADPAVVMYFQQGLPGFQPVGVPERIQTAMGPGVILTFQGSMGGPPLQQKTYIVLHNGMGIFLAHLSTADIAGRRDAVARQIFQSFSWGEADRDQAVVGTWQRDSGMVSDGGSGYGSSSRVEYYTFQPDGTVVYQYESSISVDVDGLSAHSGSGPQTWRGTFAAGQGTLYMRFNNGESQEYRYELVQDQSGAPVLKFTSAAGDVEYYRHSG